MRRRWAARVGLPGGARYTWLTGWQTVPLGLSPEGGLVLQGRPVVATGPVAAGYRWDVAEPGWSWAWLHVPTAEGRLLCFYRLPSGVADRMGWSDEEAPPGERSVHLVGVPLVEWRAICAAVGVTVPWLGGEERAPAPPASGLDPLSKMLVGMGLHLGANLLVAVVGTVLWALAGAPGHRGPHSALGEVLVQFPAVGLATVGQLAWTVPWAWWVDRGGDRPLAMGLLCMSAMTLMLGGTCVAVTVM